MTNNSKLTTAAQKQCEVRRQGNQIHFNILIIRLIRKRLCISAEQLRHRTMESYGQQISPKSLWISCNLQLFVVQWRTWVRSGAGLGDPGGRCHDSVVILW